MEQWEKDFEWLRVRHQVKDVMGKDKLPDMNAILFLIGIQEVGQPKLKYTKEEKQDLMHVAVCKLLSYDGYYEFEGKDDDGWPHYSKSRKLEFGGVEQQEEYLKEKVIRYFKSYIEENKEDYES
jgi:hypothetical protein